VIVDISVGQSNIAVINGSVRNWGGRGVDLQASSPDNCRVEGVQASGNADHGIGAVNGCRVTNCSAFSNGGHGITADDACTISNCTAISNTFTGILVGNGCTVVGCTVRSNGSNGLFAAAGSTVQNCSATGNTGIGFSISSGCTVSGCTSYNNTGAGIGTSSGCTVVGCTARDNNADKITSSGCGHELLGVQQRRQRHHGVGTGSSVSGYRPISRRDHYAGAPHHRLLGELQHRRRYCDPRVKQPGHRQCLLVNGSPGVGSGFTNGSRNRIGQHGHTRLRHHTAGAVSGNVVVRAAPAAARPTTATRQRQPSRHAHHHVGRRQTPPPARWSASRSEG
jgi:parallel beta-helix repeat protein